MLAKIKAAIKPTTTDFVLKLGSSRLEIRNLAAGADDDAIRTAVTTAAASPSSFAGCFDMAN